MSAVRPPGAHALPLGRPITRSDVLTAAQVADLLGVKKSTVEEWARRGIIPSRKKGRRRFFLRWEIEAWLLEQDH